MSISATEIRLSPATSVSVSDDTLAVDLADGRTISVPLEWFPRLVHAAAAERSSFRISGAGDGIHWPDLDEDVSVAGLLAGRPSGDSQSSLAKWLKHRTEREGGRCPPAISKDDGPAGHAPALQVR